MQFGLRSLTKLVLGVDLDKTSSVRRSDWEAEVLTSQQVKLHFIVMAQLDPHCRSTLAVDSSVSQSYICHHCKPIN